MVCTVYAEDEYIKNLFAIETDSSSPAKNVRKIKHTLRKRKRIVECLACM